MPACVCMYVLRIVSADKILCFTNTLINVKFSEKHCVLTSIKNTLIVIYAVHNKGHSESICKRTCKKNGVGEGRGL